MVIGNKSWVIDIGVLKGISRQVTPLAYPFHRIPQNQNGLFCHDKSKQPVSLNQ